MGDLIAITDPFSNNAPELVSLADPWNNSPPNHIASALGYQDAEPSIAAILAGRFKSTLDGWTAGAFGGGSASASWNAGGWADLIISVQGTDTHFRQNIPAGAWLLGHTYLLRFKAKATSAHTIQNILVYESTPASNVFIASASPLLSTAWQTFEFLHTVALDPGAGLNTFIFQASAGWTGTISFDDIELLDITGGGIPAYRNAAPAAKTWTA